MTYLKKLENTTKKMTTFKDSEGLHNRVDDRGNHFVQGVCINPLVSEGLPIGSTIPKDQYPDCEVTGFVPHMIVFNEETGRDEFIRVEW